MDPKVRKFVESFRIKKLPELTVGDIIKDNNHEKWKKCKACGHEEDLRKTSYCSHCGTEF